MRKKLAVASFAAFLAAASLTACGSSKDAQTTAAQTEVQTEAAETEVQEEKTETEASADDRAYEGTTLNVMLAYGGAEKSFDAFTEKTGIKVEYVEISTGKALAQMQAENGVQSAVFENGALRIEYAAGCAYLDGEELHLTPIEYKLLCLLSQNAGKVLTHTFITQKIWGSSWENDIASLRVFMATLRKKLEKNGEQTQYIQTHIGVGYRMLKVE